MGRVSLATVLLISMLLGGCFGAPIAEWGSGNGEFETKWDNSPETLFNVTSKISEGTAQMDLNLQGCDDAGGEIKAGSTGEVTQEVKVSGWLVASKHFTEGVNEPSEKVITTSVFIGLDSFNVAKEKTFEDYDKFNVKEWDMPTTISTMPKLDSSSLDHSKYGVVGLIPANEEVLEGFASLNEWHQPIEIVGYAVNLLNPTAQVVNGQWEVGEDCRAIQLQQTGIAMVVTGINLEDESVSMDGNGWKKGDIPYVGTYVYLLLVLIAGGGGAFLLFTFSVGIERQGAKSAAKAMLTDAQMKMAKVVRKDVKKAKKDGLDMSAGSMIATEEKDEGKSKVTQKLDDFDVESVLSSIGEGRGQGAELGGGGVILTDDAYDMGDQLQDSIDSGGINLGESTERIGHTLAFDIDDILNANDDSDDDGFEFSAPQRTTRESSERKRVTGRQSVSSNDEVYDSSERRGPPKRRAVRKTKNNDDKSTRRGPPVRKSPPQRKPDLDDSDEFSDFSF